MDKYLIMISLDGVDSEDLKTLETCPNFQSLYRKGAMVRNVNSVFISNTYPAHASVITGVHPNKHGIYDNLDFSKKVKSDNWRTNSKKIRAIKLYDEVIKAGGTVASLLYPTTGNSKIQYNFPEIPGEMSVQKRASRTLREGSKGFIFSQVLSLRKQLTSFLEPMLSDFVTATAVRTIENQKPNLLLIHLLDTDMQKHEHGIKHPEVGASLRRHDRRIGEIIDSVVRAGIYDRTNFIIFSDHGCLDVKKAVKPNKYLYKHAFIRFKNGKMSDCDALFHESGGSAFLKIYNNKKRVEVEAVFRKMLQMEFAHRELTKAEMHFSGMDKEFDFGMVAKEGYCFGEFNKGQHGYTLDRPDYKPFYLANGENVMPGEYTGGSIVDICPLAAKLMGIPLWEMDGVNRVALADEKRGE